MPCNPLVYCCLSHLKSNVFLQGVRNLFTGTRELHDLALWDGRVHLLNPRISSSGLLHKAEVV